MKCSKKGCQKEALEHSNYCIDHDQAVRQARPMRSWRGSPSGGSGDAPLSLEVMSKADLVARIAAEAGIPKKKANLVLHATVGAITDVLRTGDKITITGLGTFSIARRAGRTGRNPRTGQAIRIAPSRLPRFRPSKGLKDSVR